MLTRSMFNGQKLQVADLELDPARLTRSAVELATHDLPELVRRADVPGRMESGMDAASDAIRTAVERLPGQRRRSPWRPWIPGVAIVSVLAVVAIAGWWMARSAALSAARATDLELDEDALARATNEGMPGDPAALPLADATAPGGAVPATSAAGFGLDFPA